MVGLHFFELSSLLLLYYHRTANVYFHKHSKTTMANHLPLPKFVTVYYQWFENDINKESLAISIEILLLLEKFSFEIY